MITAFRSPTADELAHIAKVMARRGILLPDDAAPNLRLALERCGRFTLCLLDLHERQGANTMTGKHVAWGAAGLATTDIDTPQIGARIALAKASRMLAEHLIGGGR